MDYYSLLKRLTTFAYIDLSHFDAKVRKKMARDKNVLTLYPTRLGHHVRIK